MTFTLSFAGEEIPPSEMGARVARAAGALAASGIREGDTFAVMMRNEPATLEIFLAARQLGAYFTPLNWHFKSEEAGYILRDSGSKLLIVHSDLLPQISSGIPTDLPVYVARPHPHLAESFAISPGTAAAGAPLRDWNALTLSATPVTEASATPRGLIAYTSGTTGKPKGVRRLPPPPEHAAVIAQRTIEAVGAALGVTAESRCLVSAPLYHSAPCSFAMFAATRGAWLRLEARFDAERTLALIGDHGITHPYLVPTMYVRMLRLPAEVRGRADLSSVQFVSSTGSFCAAPVKRAMIDWWGEVINETYASSETGYLTLMTAREARLKPGSAGRPLPGVSLKILDDEGRELPAGAIGRIYARSSVTTDFTYINRQEDRNALEAAGYVTVGDLGYLDDDGYLFVVDRRTDLVLSGGVNVYPAEIEQTLLGMPGIADAAVFGIPDAEFGHVIVAVIMPVNGQVLTERDVRDHLSARLANFKLPRIIEFRDELPREDTGKIFKRRLRDEFEARAAAG